jgi:hypothetical protein
MEIITKVVAWVKANPKTVIFLAGVASALAVKYIF